MADNEQALRLLKHDIKNQLSNIHLALEQLRFEVENPTADVTFYMDTIAMSCTKINSLLKEAE
jgi:hypothetical protein